ncbi:type II secretion system F family protein [Agromyces sp. MMS24-JH15]|uniref:type II secretion system F family protein n=1 Tax=Agromyces sp. MMS24-JH15 TaxID=3243765 RepID=UPI003749B99F
MPQTYAYVGRTQRGKLVKGKMDAPSEATVLSRMAAEGLSAVSVDEYTGGTGLNREINVELLRKKPKLKDLAVMVRQMATMLAAGLSVLKTLTVLADQTESKPLAAILGKARDLVEQGSSISDAFARAGGRDIPPIMVSMMRAGEAGGFLDRALDSVAVNLEKDVKLRGTIRAALTYPLIVLGMAVLAVIGMLVFIVPIFKDMFAGLGSELPIPTQILVWLSEQMIWILPVVAVIAIVGGVWWSRNKREPSVRRAIDPWKLRAPVFGPLVRKIAIARFARNLSNMLAAGVPLLQSLRIVGDTSGNYVIEKALDDVAESVRQGRSFAGPLAEQPVFPPMVVQMISVGEDSGSLGPMLDKVADFYEAEVDAASEQLTAAIEPLMIAFLGIIIGGMVVALYLPIFGIATAVQGA